MHRLVSGAARRPGFRRLWAAQTISLVGTGLGALPFTAILFLDASATEMALLAAFAIAPGLLAGLPAGAWVDRARRRPLLIAADLGRALALASLLVAAAFDALRIEHLFAVALVNGALEVLFDAAYLAYLPALVPEDELVDANSRLAGSAAVAEAGSFSVGGWIAQLAGSLWAVAADALSFVASAAFVWRIRAFEPGPAARTRREGLLAELGAGGRLIAGDSRLAAIAASNVFIGLGHGFIGASILLFGTRTLGLGTGVLGLIFGAGGLSALAGAMLAGPLAKRFGPGRAMLFGATVSGLASLWLVGAGGPPWLAALFLVAGQLSGDPFATVREVNEVSLRQAITPAAALGRVNAGLRFVQLAAMLAGSLAAALLAPPLGLRGVIATGAACNLAVPAVLASCRRFRAPALPAAAPRRPFSR